MLSRLTPAAERLVKLLAQPYNTHASWRSPSSVASVRCLRRRQAVCPTNIGKRICGMARSRPFDVLQRPRDSSQSRHFVEAARKLGCDESEVVFDAKLRKIAQAK